MPRTILTIFPVAIFLALSIRAQEIRAEPDAANATGTAGDPAQAQAATSTPPYQDPYHYKGFVTPLPPPSPPPELPKTEPKKWGHWLPFFAQRIIDRGIELPLPYDIAYSFFHGYQRLRMTNLEASVGTAPVQPLDFVHFDTTKIYTQSNQFQIGAWVFPFLNVYGIFGYVRGHGDINITFSSPDDIGRLPGFGGLGGPGPISIPTQRSDYKGSTYGAGFTLAGHIKKIFISIPFTFMASDISMSDTNSRTINIAPRAGASLRLGRFGVIIVYAGATYFYLNADITGHFDIPLNNRPGETFRFNYSISQRASGAWSGLAGASWMINKNFNLILEKGYGYNRANIIATVFFRF